MLHTLDLHFIDYFLLAAYFSFVIGIGWVLKRRMKNSSDFFLSGRSIPAWVAGLAFLSANLGAQEVIGMAASGAKYGIMTSQFYWVGAIPAMLFLAIFMMPFYHTSKVRTVPEYLKLRFDEKTRDLNAISFAVMTVFSSGISLHVLAEFMEQLIGWSYSSCIVTSAAIVLVYIFFGGLTSAIYNEVLQFFMIVFGFAPLVFLALQDIGGWSALKAKLIPVATAQGFAPGTWSHAWQYVGSSTENPMGVGWFGLLAGLGFALSFGYWCTDFLVVQRAMAADSIGSAQRTPLIAAIPKMLFPALVILPGMIAIAIYQAGEYSLLPPIDAHDPSKGVNYNMAIPALLARYFPSGMLGLGLTALMASFMSGMAGNVTAFNTVWTYDIYQSYIAPCKSDHHYLLVGQLATVVGTIVSIGTAYFASQFNNILDMVQLVFGFVNAPLFATFLLGMFWKRATGDGAFWGMLSGILGAAVFHGITLSHGSHAGIKGGWITPRLYFNSEMGQNLWVAIVAWTICFVLTVVVSLVTRQKKTDAQLTGLVYSLTPTKSETWHKRPLALCLLVLVGTALLNIVFW